MRLLLVVAGLWGSTANAQPTAPGAANPPPAPPKVDPAPPAVAPPAAAPPAVAPPAPAPPKPSPKQVAQSLAAAIEKGDAAALRAAVVTEGVSPQLADATLALAGALRRLDAVAATRFTTAVPPTGFSQGTLHVTESLKAVEGAVEKIEGDQATLTLAAGGKPAVIRFKRAGDEWRVDLTPAGEDAKATEVAAKRLLKLYDLLIKAADQTAAEISAGAVASVEEGSAAFARRVLKARILAD